MNAGRGGWPLAVAVSMVALQCSPGQTVLGPVGTTVAIGTWGADNAGLLVDDMLAHAHFGCTYGDIPERIPLDTAGKFSVTGSYLLRAFPVAVGPTMPAQFSGQVTRSGLTMTIVVNDTVAHASTTLGPVTLVYGNEPRMQNCPICRDLSARRALLRAARGPTRLPSTARQDIFRRPHAERSKHDAFRPADGQVPNREHQPGAAQP